VAPDRDNGEGRPGYRLLDDAAYAEEESDVHAIKVDRAISVTPLSLDLTSRTDFNSLTLRPATDVREIPLEFASPHLAYKAPAGG
jgi:broad specificity polyphosphatase/5'/3'-nucleotidase SurE